MRQNEKQEEWIVPIGGSEKITGGRERKRGHIRETPTDINNFILLLLQCNAFRVCFTK